jgi:hypothetical protein
MPPQWTLVNVSCSFPRMRTVVIAVVSATVALLISAQVGSGAPKRPQEDIYPGGQASFVGLDVGCSYLNAGGGHVLLCSRESGFNGVGVTFTGGWLRVWSWNKKSATCCKTLLYQHRRNP